ncbi:MAG: histidine--tRNA ligase [Candidatus Aenigmarchaeota archaeon]|nr:histidine--tRNA ligase [Candidatus Aenigmarchaeota archaeon]MDW8149227.1 histidine--tRNA ligase [Candidatus Aenigmarchaeota archaeon]
MKFQNVKGTADYFGDEAFLRNNILDDIKEVFEKYGFLPLETPVLETFELLSIKDVGEQIKSQIYNFKDFGGRHIGLRFDLTLPLARFVANNPNLQLPFKRYQIGKVWRYEDVKKNRLREFYQADIDVVGSDSIEADVEVVACGLEALEKLGIKNFVLRLNNIKVMNSFFRKINLANKSLEILRILDKLDKIGKENVKKELRKIGVDEEKIFDFIENKKIYDISELDGSKEIFDFLDLSKIYGFDKKIKIDFSLARGLEYYTGNIFEVSVEEEKFSIAGGGRYDNLIGKVGKRNLPAVGFSIGVERVFNLLKSEYKKEQKIVFVANIKKEQKIDAIRIVLKLRENGIKTEYDLKNRDLKSQLEYANNKKIPFVILVGKEEIEKGIFRLKDMKKREEILFNSFGDLINFLKRDE